MRPQHLNFNAKPNQNIMPEIRHAYEEHEDMVCRWATSLSLAQTDVQQTTS
jgi:hypothetical protein